MHSYRCSIHSEVRGPTLWKPRKPAGPTNRTGLNNQPSEGSPNAGLRAEGSGPPWQQPRQRKAFPALGGPSTHYLRSLARKPITGVVFGAKSLDNVGYLWAVEAIHRFVVSRWELTQRLRSRAQSSRGVSLRTPRHKNDS